MQQSVPAGSNILTLGAFLLEDLLLAQTFRASPDRLRAAKYLARVAEKLLDSLRHANKLRPLFLICHASAGAPAGEP